MTSFSFLSSRFKILRKPNEPRKSSFLVTDFPFSSFKINFGCSGGFSLPNLLSFFKISARCLRVYGLYFKLSFDLDFFSCAEFDLTVGGLILSAVFFFFIDLFQFVIAYRRKDIRFLTVCVRFFDRIQFHSVMLFVANEFIISAMCV